MDLSKKETDFLEKLKSTLIYFKENDNKSFKASDIRARFNFPIGHNNFATHGLLTLMREEGLLKKMSDRQGFKYKQSA